MDGPFTVFPILSLYLFYKGKGSERAIRYGFLTGISLSCGMLMTYSTVFIGLFFNVVILLTLILDRKGFRHTLTLLLIAGVTFTAFYLLMFLFTGFNLLEALQASIGKDREALGTGYETVGLYLHLSVGNLFAFLIGIGIPMTTVWVTAGCANNSGRTVWRADRHLRHWLSNLIAGGCLFRAFHNGS